MLIHRDQRLDIQLGASEVHPHGRVVTLSPGWNDLDDSDTELFAHPIVKRLLPSSAAEGRRLIARHEAEVKRDEAIAEAYAEYNADMGRINTAADKERAAAVTAWEKEHAKAAELGQPYNEPHPDPEQASLYARTGGPPPPVPTATLNQLGGFDDHPGRVVPKSLAEKKAEAAEAEAAAKDEPEAKTKAAASDKK